MSKTHGNMTRRISAVLLSCVLVLTTMISAHAHGAHHDHSAHIAWTGDAGNLSDHHEPDELPAHDPQLCLDLICHGGAAVLPEEAAVIPLREPQAFERMLETVPDWTTLALDRPPRSTALT